MVDTRGGWLCCSGNGNEGDGGWVDSEAANDSICYVIGAIA